MTATPPRPRPRWPGLLGLLWVEDRTRTLVAALNAGEIDGAVLALEADIGDLASAVICRDPFVLAAPAAHPLGRSRSPATLDALRNAEVLLLDEGHCLRDQALAVCAKANAREMAFRATSLATLAQMVAGGAGVTLLPQLAVPTETRRGDIQVRPLAAPAPYRTIALVWRKRSPLGPALEQLAGMLRAACPVGRAVAPERATGPMPRTGTNGRRRRKRPGQLVGASGAGAVTLERPR
jgi:LysR family hydrogen peroxide-inducible transcriptional activator